MTVWEGIFEGLASAVRAAGGAVYYAESAEDAARRTPETTGTWIIIPGQMTPVDQQQWMTQYDALYTLAGVWDMADWGRKEYGRLQTALDALMLQLDLLQGGDDFDNGKVNGYFVLRAGIEPNPETGGLSPTIEVRVNCTVTR